MKYNNWWVQQGLLTTVLDPTGELSDVTDRFFPDEYVPMVFMTGDGHRHPPFRWTERGIWPGIFGEVVHDNKLCCHVETYADAVRVDSVPAGLAPVFHNGKVFGWEPEVFKVIEKILEAIPSVMFGFRDKEPQALSDVHYLTKEMWVVHGHGYLRAEGLRAMQFWDRVRRTRGDMVGADSLPGFAAFLNDYSRSAMALRTGANDVMGAIIQRKIDQYPDHMHLITCGDAHITENPLYRYIRPPVGCFGIADRNKG